MTAASTLDWLAEEVRTLTAGAAPSASTYSLSVWCGDEDDAFPDETGPWGWTEVAAKLSLWGLRRALRHVRRCGWAEDCSVLVERNGERL
jgi:hypothetical protein